MNGKQSNGFASFNGMDSSERTRLLAVIDKFRELGISEDISLPQVRLPCGPNKNIRNESTDWSH